MSSVRLSPASALALAAALLALLAFVPGARAADGAVRTLEVPSAGEILWEKIGVRESPSLDAPRIALLSQFTPEYHRRVVLAVGAKYGADGKPVWYRISVPGRPNGRVGWVPAASVAVKPARFEIVIYRGARRLELRDAGKVVLATRVAIGRPGRETPLGLFFVTHRFVPSDPFLGSFALATSAYSKMSEWPGGGVVGIHGTSVPQFLGQAVSSGCIRLANHDVLKLMRLVPVGTPIRILR